MVDVSETFIASISRDRFSAQVTCVLWGHCLLNVHGVPSIVSSIDFVIPNDSAGTAEQTLARSDDLVHCSNPEVCHTSSKDRRTPPPAFHFHIRTSDITVGIYLQSETLWFMPPLRESLPSPSLLEPHSSYILASDQQCLPPWRPGRGSGFFKSGEDPIIVPKSHILLEAFLRLYARDAGQRIGGFALPMIGYMEMYVDDDGFLDARLLPEPLQKFYRELREGKKPVRQWMKELKAALGIPFQDSEDDSD
ncbi:hypothetical protein BN1723_007718 [Verticillium longisporum]|uniref:Thioredoxin reductase n=1 Tax=Verticillium longisporum TaxID=100787 RepID=A0A0G4NMQ4_VERLO|nr:hypothetical protein BN1723_007718 [Verticillium longisporum]